MKRSAFALLLALAACQETPTATLAPLPLTAESVGHYCQMNLLEHPGPKAQVHLDGLPGAPLFFSQVRDAVAYARLPEQSHVIQAIWVNDMGAPGATWDDPGATNWIKADTAYYVVGSAREGGMGAPELVPFAAADAAQAFAGVEGGKVLRLDDIPDTAVIADDAPDTDPGAEAEFAARIKALSNRNGD